MPDPVDPLEGEYSGTSERGFTRRTIIHLMEYPYPP